MRRKEQLLGLADAARPRLDDSMYEEPQLHVYGIDPVDGLPRLRTPAMSQTKAPKFSPDRFVCCEDSRTFVLPDDSCGVPKGASVPESCVEWHTKDGAFVYRAQIKSFGCGSAHSPETWVTVVPVRPQCRFYKRQLIPFEDTGRNMVQRMCTAATNENNEFYSLNGQEVLACEFRDPMDKDTAFLLRQHEKKIESEQMLGEAAEAQDDFDPASLL